MFKKILPFFIVISFLLVKQVSAVNNPLCVIGQKEGDPCPSGTNFQCLPDPVITKDDGKTPALTCQDASIITIFGKIKPPAPLAGLMKDNPSGAWVISMFFSNFVTLLFSIATIALVFMIIWSAFEWLTSGGDKEKLANAQKRLINAFIGIILFATAFAIIRVVGIFTGFTFFKGQNVNVISRDKNGNITKFSCNNGTQVGAIGGTWTLESAEARCEQK